MSRSTVFTTIAAALFVASSALAQAPAGAPSGATGACKDGSYTTATSKRGACRGHKGVKDWYAAATPAATASPAAAAPPATATKAPVAATKSRFSPAATAAPGGGAGLVWANKESKVYHCQGDRWYGKTKEGTYLSEADAKAQGYRANHGKGCQN